MLSTKMTTTNRSEGVLTDDQVQKLDKVLHQDLVIGGQNNFPDLEFCLRDLVINVQDKLEQSGFNIKSVRLNGGAASYILAEDPQNRTYNDIDLIFYVSLDSNQFDNQFDLIRDSVLNCLLKYFPSGANLERITPYALKMNYAQKHIKVVNDNDRWSLISFANRKLDGKHIELKFVDKMKRQFEFSVDSFQIRINDLIQYWKSSDSAQADDAKQTEMPEMPVVFAESVYGDFLDARRHLNEKKIATIRPEEIRGGGLFKYCYLLQKGYHPEPSTSKDVLRLEQYMCSRFFIDFSEISQQHQKLECYLASHFTPSERYEQYEYLVLLKEVVERGTVCLMRRERNQVIDLIERIAYVTLQDYQYSQDPNVGRKMRKVQSFDKRKSRSAVSVSRKPRPIYELPAGDMIEIYYGRCDNLLSVPSANQYYVQSGFLTPMNSTRGQSYGPPPWTVACS